MYAHDVNELKKEVEKAEKYIEHEIMEGEAVEKEETKKAKKKKK